MHPDDLLEQLKTGVGLRKARNLDIVHVVCREQYERGSKDYSVATIARLSVERGGPTAQTIHNKTGDDFKGLIAAWARHTDGVVRKPRKANENPIYAVLDKIPDPAVRAVMGCALAENRKLRGELNVLKQQANIVVDKRPLAPANVQQQAIQILPPSHGLTESEKEALRHAISDKLMEVEGWQQDENGRILNSKGRAIFKIGFVSAIRKILGS
ncbi:gamma-mobile-trio protein GmtX [Paraburkholderia oxyphila]|uniref:gamma-mobile-trio protein GmtX n=1 Tax=Paraburkholderia oxyphila TaxID=614212 RepID=UPI000A65C852|nr:gamma-mobile-trio protein GmtX [Paraburkholderia oxyphila]